MLNQFESAHVDKKILIKFNPAFVYNFVLYSFEDKGDLLLMPFCLNHTLMPFCLNCTLMPFCLNHTLV